MLIIHITFELCQDLLACTCKLIVSSGRGGCWVDIRSEGRTLKIRLCRHVKSLKKKLKSTSSPSLSAYLHEYELHTPMGSPAINKHPAHSVGGVKTMTSILLHTAQTWTSSCLVTRLEDEFTFTTYINWILRLCFNVTRNNYSGTD